MESEMPRKPSPSPPPESQPSSPPLVSLTSSPSHEFSFTISLHPPTPLSPNSTKPAEFDLSPADDIFFHGHLLPLQFLSHRPSNVSIETIPKLTQKTDNQQSKKEEERFDDDRAKTKTFSSLFAIPKWLRGGADNEAEKQRNKKKKKKKKKLLGRIWKKYAILMEPILFFKSLKERRELRRSSYSFSGDFNPREGGWRRRWRGEFSAPASMRTSPANSGLLVAPTSAFSSSDESSMEELQNAIQAAIAHCKNSVAVKESKCGC